MKKFILLLLALILLSQSINAQNIGISDVAITPDASSMLEIKATNKGLLIPRVDLTGTMSASPITSPATSLLVYNTATAGTAPNNVTPGYYYWTGSKWMRLLAVDDKVAWLLTGNSGTDPATNFLGTADDQPLVIKTNNTERSRILSNGQVLINRTTADYSVDLLEVQGNSTYPFAINGLTDQASGAGVYGYNSANGGIAIIGEAATNGIGVFGSALTGYGIYGSARGGTGVYADDSSAAGTGQAIYAKNFHKKGAGILAAGNNLNPKYLTDGVGGSFASTNVGVYGYGNNTSKSKGVLGRSAAADGIGIVAEITAAAGTSNGCGILASSNQSKGFGVWGANKHTNGTGVVGAGNNQDASYLTDGSGGAFTGSNTGSYSISTNSTGTGVIGAGNNQTASYLTDGSGGAFTGTNTGSYGIAINAKGTGVIGVGNNQTANVLNNGSGGAFTGSNTGSYSISTNSTGTGVVGVGNNQTASYLTDGSGGAFTGSNTGSYGISTNLTGTGVVGVGNNQSANILTNGSGGAFTGDSIGVYGKATKSGDGTFGGYFTHGDSAYAYVGGIYNSTNYKINGSGTVSTIVKNTAGERVNLYCPEAPEIYFQDYGEGQLVNGKAHIELDPDFAKNVIINEKHPLRVFIQLEDDCQGVYVTNKTKTGFDVIELNGGKSNAKFMWTVTANRADEVDENGNIISKYADVRFAPAPGPLESIDVKQVKADNKEITKNIKDIKEIEEVKSLDKNNININKTNNQ